jgi:hypothetical protein
VLVQHLEDTTYPPRSTKDLGTGEIVVTKDNLDSPEVGAVQPRGAEDAEDRDANLPKK